jgi:hypothetical protein
MGWCHRRWSPRVWRGKPVFGETYYNDLKHILNLYSGGVTS